MKKSSDITRWVLYEPLPKLCQFMQGTKAAAHIDMSSEKTAGSIRSVASSHLGCFEYLKDTENPFSIREWSKKEDDESWLFLFCKPSQRSSLNPLISSWLSLSMRSLMHLNMSLERRLWFVMDELPSLNKVKDLEPFLAESRKFGGCDILSIQSPAQLESIYGRKTTQTIIGNCSTKIVFSEQDPEIAEAISRSFGKREVKEYQEEISYGAHEVRDGVSLTMQTKSLPLVSASDIQSLEKNEAYTKLPGNVPATKIRLYIRWIHMPIFERTERALEEEDFSTFLLSLKDVVRVHDSITSVAEKAHISRSTLYKLFSEKSNQSYKPFYLYSTQ